MELLERLEKLENDLYKARYIDKDYVKRQSIWNEIKEDKGLLRLAIEVVKDKFGKRDTFRANAVTECILLNPEVVDKEIYQELVDKIYSSTDLARIVLDGASNGGYSFLLYTIQNDDLELTEEQREFALSEAMNKRGTLKSEKVTLDYEAKLDGLEITDDKTIPIPGIGPCGAKTANLFLASICNRISDTQAHGFGDYDIRYYILKNHNFEDKFDRLIFDFYSNAKRYDGLVDMWECDIVDMCRPNGNSEPVVYVDEVMYITPEELYERLPKAIAEKVIKEIAFIKRIHEARPLQYEFEEDMEDEICRILE